MGSEVVELQAEAARTLTEIRTPLDPGQLQAVAREPDAPASFQVYGPDGSRLYGTGPRSADDGVDRALRGETTSGVSGGSIVVVTPVTEQGTERVLGAVCVTEPLSEADRRSAAALAVIVGTGALAIVVAWLVARRVAARLSRPVVDLAEAAGRMGQGEVLPGYEAIGIAEMDRLGDALVDSSQQLHEALARERRFSADVSHQLRTPFAGLRLTLEAAAGADRRHIDGAISDLDRVEATVEHLLCYSRDLVPASQTSSLPEVVTRATERWHDRARRAGRALTTVTEEAVQVRAAAASIEQILDVLLDNSLRHGEGRIEIQVRPMAGGAAVEVRDEGSGSSVLTEGEIFARGQGAGHGIGLALARSLAEAEGGRLLRVSTAPTTFSLVLLGADHQ